MSRTIRPIEQDDRGLDTHPAFGMLQLLRYSNTPGSVLFDSDIRHGHSVVVRLTAATRERDLHHDWIHSADRIVEIEMSEAQWASFVSSMGTSGVPVTIRATEADPMVPGLEHDPRLAHSMEEVQTAAEKTFGRIEKAVAAYDALGAGATAKERRAAISEIRNATRHARENLRFASSSLVEHAENVVQRSRADIEAMAYQAAARFGLPPAENLLLELDDAPTREDA